MPCPLCDDTGWRPVEESGVRRVVRCECWKQSTSERRLTEAHIPKRYQHCTIEKLRVYNESLSEAVHSAARFVNAYPAVDRGLLFLGHAGVGKTHLAVAILRAVIQNTGVPGLFFDTRELLKTIRSSYGHGDAVSGAG
jgi:DNA replication protein DnaC